MDRAINKNTGKLISAFEIFNNGSYQNLTKGEWIAPQDSIHNWDEITEEDSYVHYVKEKEYINFKKSHVSCSPYFAIYPNSKAKTIAETKEHKMLKNWLFDKFKKDDLEIVYSKATKKYKYNNSVKLSNLNINWNQYSIEVPIRGKKNLQADILLPFLSKHPVLGFGIIIEVQLSSQNEKQTFERTEDRAISGYSVIWLFKNDFELNLEENEFELKNNQLKVYSWISELKYSGKKFVRNLKLTVEDQCRYLDEKKLELNNKIDELNSLKEKIIQETKDEIKEYFDLKFSVIAEDIIEEVSKKVSFVLSNKFFEDNKTEVYTFIKKLIKEETLEKIQDEVISKIWSNESNEISKKIERINDFIIYKEFVSDPPKCPKCGGNVRLKYSKFDDNKIWAPCENHDCNYKLRDDEIPVKLKKVFMDDY